MHQLDATTIRVLAAHITQMEAAFAKLQEQLAAKDKQIEELEETEINLMDEIESLKRENEDLVNISAEAALAAEEKIT